MFRIYILNQYRKLIQGEEDNIKRLMMNALRDLRMRGQIRSRRASLIITYVHFISHPASFPFPPFLQGISFSHPYHERHDHWTARLFWHGRRGKYWGGVHVYQYRFGDGSSTNLPSFQKSRRDIVSSTWRGTTFHSRCPRRLVVRLW